MTLEMAITKGAGLPEQAVEAFRATLRGELIGPGDVG